MDSIHQLAFSLDEPQTKRCPTCGETKVVTEFGRNKARKDGRTFSCKACKSAYVAATHLPRDDDDPAWQTISCTACGKLIRRRTTALANKKTDHVFCSKACRDAIQSKPRNGANRACEVCGNLFYAAAWDDKRFCSVPCYDEWQRRTRETRICETCGSEFELKPSQVEAGAGRFCSQKCWGVANRKRPLERLHNGSPALRTSAGYIKVWEPEHPKAVGGYILEHRLIVEQSLGRYLERKEVVHHINGVKDDNRLENLEVMDHGAHSTLTGYEQSARRKAERDALERELAAYRARYGPLENPQ